MDLDVLALDVGQSGVRTLEVVGQSHTLGLEFAGLRTDRGALRQLAVYIQDVLEARHAGAVAIGSTGLSQTERAAELLALLDGKADEVHLAHDSITSYLGALGDRSGAVIAAGTGSVTLGVGPSRVHRVDGWGYLLGDEGSGFWIGRQALTAAMWAFDGRGPATLLLDDLRDEFTDVAQAYLDIQADPNRVARIASWARRVAELAPHDAVAAKISRSAGQMLAYSAATALRVVDAEPRVSRLGNVFLNPLIAETFEAEVAELMGEVELVIPAGSGLDGAALLPTISAEAALGAHIDRAGSVVGG